MNRSFVENLLISLVAFVAVCASHSVRAQGTHAAPFHSSRVIIQSESGSPVIMNAKEGAPPAAMVAPPGAKPPGEKKDEQADKDNSEDKKGDSAGKDKTEPVEEELPTIVKRPMEPSEQPDPSELQVRPDEHGKIRFSFRGQKWPDVLEWLANVSGMSLDWQELPGDYLNLVTQREYSLDEARDLINRHLLARGFTMLANGEVLSIVKTEGINQGLVPRVAPDQLTDCLPHQFIKVSFALDWLVAEAVVEELKPMISPNGKLTALSGTNRLEAMDAAANLREIHEVLQQEQSVGSQERLVQEFVLKYARAEDVREQLTSLLGLSSNRGASAVPMTPQQMQQMQQQQAAMMAQMQQQQGGKPARTPPKKEQEVNLVVNARRNSVLAHAPVDKMAIIQKAIEVIDVPPDRERSLLLNMNRMQVYRLVLLDPDTLVRTLRDTGDLDPTTRLEVDAKNRAIIAYASLADHLTIRSVIEKLDGQSRQFEVLRLRRLDAEYVAGTVASMMGQEEAKQDDRSRYYGMFGIRFGQSSDDKEPDKFRVDADVLGNRLLLWANDTELDEVTNLLIKLGEIPAEGEILDRVRVLDLEAGEDTERLLEQIRHAWPSLAPNELQLPAKTAPSPPGNDDPDPPPKSDTPTTEARRLPSSAGRDVVRFAQLRQDGGVDQTEPSSDDPRQPDHAFSTGPDDGIGKAGSSPDDTEDTPADSQTAGATPPPVQLTIGADGRLTISSHDTAALDLLEELIGQLTPPVKDYEMFSLKYSSSLWVRLNLEDFFKDEDEDEKPRFNPYFFDYRSEPKKEKPMGLSRRRPLKFIDDPDTNTILVVGADREQLATVKDLIEMWDVPPATDSESARISAVFQIRYSRAEVIAEAIKEVYRDLLSANDKALQQDREAKRQPSGPSFIFGGGDDEPDRRTQVAFKGKLSLGIDDVSNTLLVSTEGQNLMENIRQMVEELDEAARPAAHVQVMTLRGDMNAARVREVLSEMLGKSVTGGTAANGGQPSGGGGAQPGNPMGGNGMMVAPAGVR